MFIIANISAKSKYLSKEFEKKKVNRPTHTINESELSLK